VVGSSWIVTYYSQILGADNEAKPHDVNQQAAYQQYKKITGLELMVQTALQRTQDPKSKEFVVTGTAICYGFLPPNPGDTFIATVDNGRQAIFNVVTSEKSTFMQASNYLITYQLTSYVDPVLVNDLEQKSVQSFQFVKSLLIQGQYPLLSTEQYGLYGGLQNLFMDLTSMYFRDFFSIERQTLLVPNQVYETYDHFLTRAVVDIVSTGEDFGLPKIRMPAVEGDRAMINVTVWDALIRTNRSYLITGIQQMGIVYAMIFRNWANLSGIYYTGIDQVVYPRDPRTDVDMPYDCTPAQEYINYVNDGMMRYKSLERVLRDDELGFFNAMCQCVENPAGGSLALPDIVPVTTDKFYVFTEGFYGVHGATLASRLEVLARGAIDNAVVDRGQLTELAVKAFNWPNLERFYYIPVILALIRISLLSS
jgi:hypothetical protein